MAEDGLQQPNADREARIAARRRRIQEKLAAVRQGDAPGAQEAAAAQEASKAQQQLLESNRRLLQLRHETQQAVTAVRVASDEQENARRDREERTRQELRAKLLAEAEAAAAADATIASRWASVLTLVTPQDLFHGIEQQRLACEAVIASKDRLIADMRTALKSKDEDYIKLLRRQAADVDGLLAAMGQQHTALTAAYRQELGAVEGALLQERADLLASNRREVGALLEARAAAEGGFTEKFLGGVEAFAEELRRADAEEAQVLKVKLESDIAVLEQHLEVMRATYQLNAEKLEYNYRVLLERDAENTATINQQKRKLSRQHDVLAGLRAKYAAGDAKAAEENGRLTDEYRRITQQFNDLQAKFQQAVRVDSAKHSQLWRLQQEEASGLVRQLLAADRVIHEQQLGWRWRGPDESLFVSPHNVAQQRQQPTAAAAAVCATAEQPQAAGAGAEGDAEEDEQQQQSGDAARTGGSAEVASRVADPAHYGALCLLVDEAGFLVDERAADLITQLPAHEGQLVAAASIVRALGVRDGPAFDALLDALSEECSSGGGSAGGRAGPPRLVAPGDALRRLRQFVEAEEAGVASSSTATSRGLGDSSGVGSPEPPAGGGAGTAATAAAGDGGRSSAARGRPAGGNSGGSGGSLGRALAASRARLLTGGAGGGGGRGQAVSRRAAEREREFWSRLGGAVSPAVVRVWERLGQQLGAYHGLLVQRCEGLAAVAGLRQQNEELGALLAQFAGSRINAELRVPPAATAGLL